MRLANTEVELVDVDVSCIGTSNASMKASFLVLEFTFFQLVKCGGKCDVSGIKEFCTELNKVMEVDTMNVPGNVVHSSRSSKVHPRPR